MQSEAQSLELPQDETLLASVDEIVIFQSTEDLNSTIALEQQILSIESLTVVEEQTQEALFCYWSDDSSNFVQCPPSSVGCEPTLNNSAIACLDKEGTQIDIGAERS